MLTRLLTLSTISAALLLGSGFVFHPRPPLSLVGDSVPRAKYEALAKKAAYRLKGWRRANRVIVTQRRTMLHGPTLAEAIALASVVYHVPSSTLWRRVLCESHGNRWAHNASGATSYWQFMPSTWRSTPFGGFSIYSTYAQALAAAWMMGPAGRGGEWSCR